MLDDDRAGRVMTFFLIATLGVFILVFISVKWPGALSHTARISAYATGEALSGLLERLIGAP